MFTPEARQHLDRVIAQSEQRYAGFSELIGSSLQLDQLRPTPWSPVGAAHHDQQFGSPSACRMQVNHVSVLIEKHHIRQARAYPWTNTIEVNLGQRAHPYLLAGEPQILSPKLKVLAVLVQHLGEGRLAY